MKLLMMSMGLKLWVMLNSLKKFGTLFGLSLSYYLFGAAENVSLTLQRKNISIQDALSTVDTVKQYFEGMRLDGKFKCCYEKTVKAAKELEIGEPVVPRQIKCPA